MIRWFKGESVRGSFVEVPELAYGRNYVAPVRSRRQNQTWTRLFDMESNVQEIVRGEDGQWVVIGGQNRQRASDLLQSCLRERKLRTTTKSVFRDYNFTGFRIARRPKP